jgi:hypothetical protein
LNGDQEELAKGGWSFMPDCRFVLCEGDDDKGLLETIAALPEMPKIQVRHSAECNESRTGGRSGFEHAIREFPIVSNYKRVTGFVFVTDNDNANAFKETCQKLHHCQVPESSDGIGKLDGKPFKIVLWPDTEYGDLEKLCLEVLRSKWPQSKDSVEEFLKRTGADSWASQANRNKAYSRATIVGYNEPDPYKGLGHLFRKGDLSVLHPRLEWLVKWFREVDNLLGIA